MRRYRDFEHLQAQLTGADPTIEPPVNALGLFPGEACGYELTSFNAPFTVLSGTWTVPNLHHSPTPPGLVFFRTFFGLGFLDVHVEMTVDDAQHVTAQIRIHTGAQLNLPVTPGDTISALLCLQTNAAGTAAYFLANETTAQTVNLAIDTGFPPAVRSTLGSVGAAPKAHSTPLPGSARSTSTNSSPSRRTAHDSSPTALPPPWSTGTEQPSPNRSASTTTPSRSSTDEADLPTHRRNRHIRDQRDNAGPQRPRPPVPGYATVLVAGLQGFARGSS